MARKQTTPAIPADRMQELEHLRYAVRRCEDKGLYDTAHHEMLRRLEKELGLITSGKIEDPQNGVNDGE